MAAIQLLALLAVAGGAEEVHGQSSKMVQGGQVNMGVVRGKLRLDMVGERRGELVPSQPSHHLTTSTISPS